jgi:phosphoglycerol transferase MdoB-like AlkP superfamily enzyme
MLKAGDATRVNKEFWTFIKEIKPQFYLCLLPFIIILIIFIFKKIEFEKPKLKNNIILVLLLIIISILSYLSLNISDSTQIKTNKELYKNPTLMELSLAQFGSFRFLIRDINAFMFIKNEDLIEIDYENDTTVDKDENYTRSIDDSTWLELIENETDSTIKNLHQYYISQSITQKNEYTGLFKDKNLILIMTEALDMSIIDPTLTPTLYKLKEEGWYFDNYYAPKFSCTTGESEFIAETSIIPSNTVCTPHTYVNNNYSTSIFNLFNNSGYTSTSYHGWSDKYYPRTQLHKNMGSTFYNADALGFSTTGGWTSDYEFMKKSYDIFKDTDKYFSFLITVSMHFSYDFDDATTRKNWQYVKDLDTGVSMKRYLAKAVEYDKGLEYLLNSLEEDGSLDDTVIIIFGDHHPYNLNFSYLNDFSDIDRYEDLNEDKLPFIIYNSSLQPQVISKTTSSFDILPTIANLFDLEYDPRYYTGVDIFSDEEAIAIFPNGDWVTDNAIYFASKNTYKLKNSELNEEYIQKINKIVNNKFIASDNTLKKDYFKYRFPN